MFCPNCGTQLPDDARFCGSCGTRITAAHVDGAGEKSGSATPAQGRSPARRAEKTAAQRSKNAKSEAVSKRPARHAAAPATVKSAADAVAAKAGETLGTAGQEVLLFSASPEGGETALGILGPDLPAASAMIPGPLKALGGGLKSFFASLAAAFREPKRLIPALVLAVLWLVLDILKVRGVESQATRILSFLSFAQGGMEGGAAGLIGGVLGKGLAAGAVTSVVGRLGKKPGGEKRNLGSSLKGGFGFTKDSLWPYLAGVGAALLLYLFISGGALKMTFMAGLASAYLAARSALENGFLKRLFSSVTSGGKPQAGPGAAGILRGMALGFVGAALLALAEKRLLLMIPGAVLLLGGGVMGLLRAAGVFQKKSREAQIP